MKKILIVVGTRPEIIKTAPLIKELQKHKESFDVKTCLTAQHRELLDQVLDVFKIKADFDCNIMSPRQDLYDVSSKILLEFKNVLKYFKPDFLLIYGDTTTAMIAALSAFYQKIDIGHIEAGLRTYNINSPWPEEANRRIIGILAKLHFAPTIECKNILIGEKVPENNIFVTGNTVIDALHWALEKIKSDANLAYSLSKEFSFLRQDSKLVLITAHRRESFGSGLDNICSAIKELAKFMPHVDFLFPVHPNPNVHEPVNKILKGLSNIYLIEPQNYLSFVYLMMNSYIVLTDSGGIQEEAPALGKPVLVMRDITERTEALSVGTIKVVGTEINSIIDNVKLLFEDKNVYNMMSSAINPYGDGNASQQIAKAIMKMINS